MFQSMIQSLFMLLDGFIYNLFIISLALRELDSQLTVFLFIIMSLLYYCYFILLLFMFTTLKRMHGMVK